MDWTPPAGNPNNPLNKFMAPVPKYARYAALSFAVLMTVVSWLSYTGIYRWVAEAQLSLFNQFEMHITFILTVVGYAVLFAVGARAMVWLKVLPRATEEETAQYLAANAAMSRGHLTPMMIVWTLLPWGLIGLGAGAYAKYGASIEKVTVTPMAELDAGKRPQGRFVEVSGLLPPDASLEYGDLHHADFYTPLISPSWNESKPLLVIVRSKEKPRAGMTTITGMRWPLGVPGPVRAVFERSGLNADEAILVDDGSRPDDWRFAGTFMIAGGGVVTAIALAAMFFGRRDSKQPPEPAPPVAPKEASSVKAGGRS